MEDDLLQASVDGPVQQPSEAVNAVVAQVGKALAHPRRVEILDLLSQAERGVDRIAELTGAPVGTVSAQLRVLRDARLVSTRREGTRIIYRLADPGVLQLFRMMRRVAHEQLAELDALINAFHRAAGAVDHIEAQELAARLASGTVVLIDVRPTEEYQAGHIPGARSIPLPELQARLSEIPRRAEVVAYCRGPFCLSAPAAVRVLHEAGRRARRLELGVAEWHELGNPVVRGAAGTAA